MRAGELPATIVSCQMRVISVSSSCDGDNRKDMNVKQTSSPSTTMGNSNVAFSINASDQKDEAEEEEKKDQEEEESLASDGSGKASRKQKPSYKKAITVRRGELTAPHKLSKRETRRLRDLLKGELKISTDKDEDEAEKLLDYAVDMVNRGENIGHITDEV